MDRIPFYFCLIVIFFIIYAILLNLGLYNAAYSCFGIAGVVIVIYEMGKDIKKEDEDRKNYHDYLERKKKT